MAEGEKPVSFSPDFMQALRAYSWPGNVRELSNLVDRFSTLFAGQRLSLRSLPAALLPKGLAALQLLANEGGLGDEDEAPVPDAPSWENSPVADGVVGEVSSQAYDESNASALEQMTFLSEGLAVLPPEGLSLKNRLAEIERDLISQALSRTKGNVSQTARILNLQRTTLIEKIQKFGLRAN
jgi:sigma-54 specific flagellar transcriptional regulator A